MPEKETAEKRTVRTRLERLHALLSESLKTAEEIVGVENDGKDLVEPGHIIDEIETELDRAIDKAARLTGQLSRIIERL